MRRPTGFLVCSTTVISVLALTACSGGGTAVKAGDGSAPTVSTPPISPGADPQLALQIRTGGGFVPAEYSFEALPEFTLFADGHIIVTGPTTQEYPGRALPNLLVGTLDEQAVRKAITAAREAGVGRDQDLGQPGVSDAPTTTFTLVEDGKASSTDAYALGFTASGLSDAQQARRQKLTALTEQMHKLGAAATSAYRATAVSVLVRPYDEPGTGAAEPAPGGADWPLGDLSTGGADDQFGGRCLGYTGTEAERVLAAAVSAKSNTRWHSGAKNWSLTFRPELPGIKPCAKY